MYTIKTPDGFVVGFLATGKKAIKTWIRYSVARCKAGWLTCPVRKHDAWPNNVTTVFDVTRELREIDELLIALRRNTV